MAMEEEEEVEAEEAVVEAEDAAAVAKLYRVAGYVIVAAIGSIATAARMQPCFGPY